MASWRRGVSVLSLLIATYCGLFTVLQLNLASQNVYEHATPMIEWRRGDGGAPGLTNGQVLVLNEPQGLAKPFRGNSKPSDSRLGSADTSKRKSSLEKLDTQTQTGPKSNSIFLRKLKENENQTRPRSSNNLKPALATSTHYFPARNVSFQSLAKGFYVHAAFMDQRGKTPQVKLLVLRPSSKRADSYNVVCRFTSIIRPTNRDYNSHHTHNGFVNHSSTVADPGQRQTGSNVPRIRSYAVPYEMCENHDKKFGGWMYLCTPPPGTNLSATSISVSLEHAQQDEEDPPTLENIPIRRIPHEHDVVSFMKYRFPQWFEIKSKINKTLASPNIQPTVQVKERATINLGYSNNPFNKLPSSTLHVSRSSKNEIPVASSSNSIGVCVPPLYGNINLQDIVKFVEFCRILGARRVFLYINDISPHLRQALEKYSAMPNSILSLIQWDLPRLDSRIHSPSFEPVDIGESMTAPSSSPPTSYNTLPPSQVIWNRGQILAIQDCLYTNMASFDWLLFLDIDEMLLPKRAITWHSLLESALHTTTTTTTSGAGGDHSSHHRHNQQIAALSFESVVCYADYKGLANYSEDYFQKLRRQKRTDKNRRKVFVRPRKIFELGIHHVSRLFNDTDAVTLVGQDEALIYHYRSETNVSPEWTKSVYDDTALKYSDHLMEAIGTVQSYL